MIGAQGISLPNSLLPMPGADLRATVQAAAPSRTKETAKEFEGTFLSMLLKEMRESLEPEGLFPGDSGDVQGGLFDLFMGRHMAESGGVGLAAVLERQVAPTAAKPKTSTNAPATSSPAIHGPTAGSPAV